MKVPFLRPDIRDEDIRRMVKSIKTGWLVHGQYATTFENDLGRFLHAKHTLFTSSCTASLHMALILAGIKAGDEVITTPLSWVSTSDAIIYEGANVVFADVDPTTGLLDIKEVERKITKKTKAILVVHLFGQMVDMKAYAALAKKYKITLIEDAAHALESQRDGVRPGERSFAACFSFHAAKNITSGQGGALVIHGDDQRARALRRNGVLGRDQNRRKYELGAKYDGTDFQAALLIGQLKRIKRTHAARLKVWQRYAEAFTDVSELAFAPKLLNSVHAAHMFILWVDPKKRDRIREYAKTRGVDTSIHWDPIHLEPYYQKTFGYTHGDFPNAERLGYGTISLPTYSGLTKKEQTYVIRIILEAIKKA